MPERNDEFYVGYKPHGPPRIAATSRAGVLVALVAAIALAALLVTAQARFDPGTFEFGVEREFDGVVVERPYPLLLVPESAGRADDERWVTHLLVASGKHGAGQQVAGLDGRAARITGSLIHNGRKRMIEAHQVEPLAGVAARRLAERADTSERSLGSMTLVGEIVDSKCHFGVMKPGRGKAHKACAIRCISGGIPPLLRVEDRSGRVEYFMLAAPDGGPVNRQVLELVAEPVEVSGDVTRSGDRLILHADPAAYRRLSS